MTELLVPIFRLSDLEGQSQIVTVTGKLVNSRLGGNTVGMLETSDMQDEEVWSGTLAPTPGPSLIRVPHV